MEEGEETLHLIPVLFPLSSSEKKNNQTQSLIWEPNFSSLYFRFGKIPCQKKKKKSWENSLVFVWVKGSKHLFLTCKEQFHSVSSPLPLKSHKSFAQKCERGKFTFSWILAGLVAGVEKKP